MLWVLNMCVVAVSESLWFVFRTCYTFHQAFT